MVIVIYSIGKFSNISNVPIKTLRYYDSIDLLKPSVVDKTTGYRYYDYQKISQVERIKALKSLGFSLNEIKEIINGSIKKDLNQKLIEKRNDVIVRKSQLESIISEIDDILRYSKPYFEKKYHISSVYFEYRSSITVISIKEKIEIHQMDQLVERLFQKVYAYNCKIKGNLMTIWHEWDNPLSQETEVMFEIDGDILNNTLENEVKIIPNGEYACVDFVGLYSDLTVAYDQLKDLIVTDSFFIEEYMEGLVPQEMDDMLCVKPLKDADPNNFKTKVMLKL